MAHRTITGDHEQRERTIHDLARQAVLVSKWLGFEIEQKPETPMPTMEELKSKMNRRARNAIEDAKIQTVEQLCNAGENLMRKQPGCGNDTIRNIKVVLSLYNLKLKDG